MLVVRIVLRHRLEPGPCPGADGGLVPAVRVDGHARPAAGAEQVERHRAARVGPETAAELRAHGLEPDLVPTVSTQEGLLAELPRPAGRVLFAAAEGAENLS